jgi:hypothetical protein
LKQSWKLNKIIDLFNIYLKHIHKTNLLAAAAAEFVTHYDQNPEIYLALNTVAKYLRYCKSDQLAGKHEYNQLNLKIILCKFDLRSKTSMLKGVISVVNNI